MSAVSHPGEECEVSMILDIGHSNIQCLKSDIRCVKLAGYSNCTVHFFEGTLGIFILGVVIQCGGRRGTHSVVRKLHCVLSQCVCMLFLLGWPPCQRSDMTLMEVSQRALDSLYIRNIWLLYIGVFFVNLIWYLYLFWLNKHCLSLNLSDI